MNTSIKEILAALGQSKRLLIASHSEPDGDAVGSMAAMGHIARHLGADVAYYNVSALPIDFVALELGGPWVRTMADLGDFAPDLLAVLDCGDEHRAGPEIAELVKKLPCINIDHHLGNPRFGTVANWTDPSMAATCQIMGYLAKAAGLELSGDLGEAVYLGLDMDTGSFSYDSTTADVLELSADILRNGLKLGRYFSKYQKNWPLNRLHLWGWLMQHVELHAGGRIALSVVSKETLDRFNANRADLEGYVSFLRYLNGVDVTLLARENGPGRAKASFRSVDAVSVREMAAEFGGGGHKNAAGANLDCGLEEAAQRFLEAAERHLALQTKKV